MNRIDRVLEMGLMGEIINVFSHGEFKAKKEATWTVTNLTSGGEPHQMKAIIDLGDLEPLARIKHWSIKGTVLDMRRFFFFIISLF